MTPLLLLSLLVSPAPSQQDDYLLSEGPHVQGLCWFRAERAGEALSEELLEVGEASWEAARGWTGLAAGPLEAPFLVNLYAKRKEFSASVEAIESGASKNRTAWSHWPSRQAFVKVLPILTERTYSELGLPPLTLREVAREVARLHLLEASHGDPALAPADWFLEGVMGWCAQEAMVQIQRANHGLEAPAWSTPFHDVQRLQAEGLLPSLSRLLTDDVDGLAPSRIQALQQVLVAFLAGQDQVRALGPRLARGLKGDALLAELEVDDLELAFLAWVSAQSPQWYEDAPAMARHMDGLQQTPVKGESSRCWSTAAPPAGSYTIRGEFLLYRGADPMGQVNVMLGRDGDDYISVSFNTVVGVHAWRYNSARDAEGKPPFIEITSKALEPALRPRVWTPFAVHYDDSQERVTIEIGDERLRPFDTTGRPMSGHWGLGTFIGSVGVWRGVECVPYQR